MEPTISSALSLLVIGMITVFAVLALVYITGNILIRIVNKLGDEESTVKSGDSISPNKLAAIKAAVEMSTNGRGRIINIEKVK